jgi:hypothetical protein
MGYFTNNFQNLITYVKYWNLMKAINLWIIISVATLGRMERFNQVWELEKGMMKCLNTLRCATPHSPQTKGDKHLAKMDH